MNYYERHIGDYLKDTAHLSLLEHGIYTRLLDVYYTRETAIPADQVARLIGARSKEEREALEAVLAEFFYLVDGVFHQDRCERKIERFGDKQRKAKASADARWKGREKPASSNADAMRTHSERIQDASAEHVGQKMRTHSERNADGMHSQSPDTRHQSPEENKDPPASRVPPAVAASDPARLLTAQDLEAEGVDPQHARDWLKVRKAKKAPLTATAWEAVKREASAARITPAKAVQTAAENGWQGFKAEWLQQQRGGHPQRHDDLLAGAV